MTGLYEDTSTNQTERERKTLPFILHNTHVALRPFKLRCSNSTTENDVLFIQRRSLIQASQAAVEGR